jgi:hypothetical protein
VGAFSADPADLAFALRFPSVTEADRTGAGIGRHHLRLDLGASPPGAYRLALRVTDVASGITSLPVVTPLYRTEERGAHWKQAPRRRSTIVNP